MIDNEKDSDATNEQTKEEPKTEERKATPKQVEFLSAKYTGENLEKLLKAQGVEKIEDIPMDKASELISKMKGEKK